MGYSFCKRVPSGSNTQATVPPTGACVSSDPNIDYSAACKSLEATCEQFSFCKRVSSFAQSSAMHSAPVRRLRRLRRSADHVLAQQKSLSVVPHADEEAMDVVDYTDEDHWGSPTSRVATQCCSEL